MARYAKLTVVCGQKGSGKSNRTLTQMYTGVQNGRKALIYDVNDEYGNYSYRPGEYHSIKAIYYRDVPRFTAQRIPELVRLRPLLDNGDVMGIKDFQDHLALVLKTYSNGILLVEDATVYIAPNTPMDIMGKLSTLRQRGVDVIMQYQHIGKAANPQIIGQASYLRLHKTMDSVLNYGDAFADKTEIISIAESIINKRYYYGVNNGIKNENGIFFSCVIDFDTFKIRGIFTKEEAQAAVCDFINNNSGRTIKRLMQSKNRKGELIYKSYSEAYDYQEQKMMKDFFDFK